MDVLEEKRRGHTVTLTHTNPIARSGYLDIKTNATSVNPTAPLPNTQRTEVNGITRLRHHYTLAPEAVLSVNFISTAPAPPTLNFEAILPGRGIQKKHVTKVYEAVPEELRGTTYQERQIPLIFSHIPLPQLFDNFKVFLFNPQFPLLSHAFVHFSLAIPSHVS